LRLGTGYFIWGGQALFGFPQAKSGREQDHGHVGFWMPGFMQFITGIHVPTKPLRAEPPKAFDLAVQHVQEMRSKRMLHGTAPDRSRWEETMSQAITETRVDQYRVTAGRRIVACGDS
jgi:hypothetical protein